MIACYAWTNTQIINVTNAKINLYPDEQADLYVRMGGHMSDALISVVRASGVYRNVFCLDPASINYNKLRFGAVKNLRVLFLKEAYQRMYDSLLDRICPKQKYTRVLLTWFYTENVFMVDYWNRYTDSLKVTLVEDGTGSYCYTKKDMLFPLSLIGSRKEKIKRYLAEYSLSKKYASCIDSICLYRPEYCRPDIDFKKLTLPMITPDSNPLMHDILCQATAGLDNTHLIRYNKRNLYYLSTYSVEGKTFDMKSIDMLTKMEEVGGCSKVIAKIHQGNTTHATKFAASHEDKIFVDREKYIFEGLYTQLDEPGKKIFVSCVSTAAIYPKFMFGHEPYVIFTYRLYDTYRQCGVERDDWMAAAVRDSYTDKSRVMVPNSFDEFKSMLRIAVTGTAKEYDIPEKFREAEVVE